MNKRSKIFTVGYHAFFQYSVFGSSVLKGIWRCACQEVRVTGGNEMMSTEANRLVLWTARLVAFSSLRKLYHPPGYRLLAHLLRLAFLEHVCDFSHLHVQGLEREKHRLAK